MHVFRRRPALALLVPLLALIAAGLEPVAADEAANPPSLPMRTAQAPAVPAQPAAPAAAAPPAQPPAQPAAPAPAPAPTAASENGTATPTAAIAPAPAAAATPEKPAEAAPVEFDPETRKLFDRWRIEISQTQAVLERQDPGDQALRDVEGRAAALRSEADAFLAQLAPRLAAVTARLGQLSPAEGTTAATGDADLLTTTRNEQTALLNTLQAADKQARVVRLRASELLSQVSDLRRDMLLQHLSQQQPSVFNPEIWRDFALEVPRTLGALAILATDWGRLIAARGTVVTIGLLILSLVGSLALFLPVRRFLIARSSRDPDLVEVPPRRKAGAALTITVIFCALPVVSLLVVTTTLTTFNLVPGRVSDVLQTLVLATAIYSLFHGLVVALVAPDREAWSYVPLASSWRDPVARRMLSAAGLGAILFVIQALAKALAVPTELINVFGGAVAIVIALLAMAALRAITRGLREEEATDAEAAQRGISIWRWILPVVWLIAIGAIVAASLGFVTLAQFLAAQIIWSAVVLALSFLMSTTIDETLKHGFAAESRLGRRMTYDLGLSGATIEQIGVLLSGVMRLAVFIITLALLLAPLGISSADWSRYVSITLTTLTIGNVTIAFGAILLALLAFFAGVLVTRGLQGWLNTQFLPRTRMDVGLKTSISTGLGYLGIIGAGMAAFSIAGVSLENVALLAGALSVGIGFGLQSIVNNFVSGIILLAERPIKVGDWIVVGSDEGTVQRVNVRSTEVLTFDRQTIIIPNSSLISGVVKNWMHGDTSGRVSITISVSYDADPDKVRDILLECATEHPLILSFPEPKVFFAEFAASSLDFRLIGYLADVGTGYGVRSDLRYAVLKKFRAAGIEIPFAQQDVNLRDITRLEGLVSRLADARAPGRAAAAD